MSPLPPSLQWQNQPTLPLSSIFTLRSPVLWPFSISSPPTIYTEQSGLLNTRHLSRYPDHSKKSAEWKKKLIGKKIGTKHDEVTFAKQDLPNGHNKLRVLGPNSAWTQDWVHDRLNVHVDKDGIVNRVLYIFLRTVGRLSRLRVKHILLVKLLPSNYRLTISVLFNLKTFLRSVLP
jgi:hypothetical protein